MTIVAPKFGKDRPSSPVKGKNNLTPLVRLQRSVGEAEISFKRRADRTALARVHQSGCCKARFPVPEPHACPEAVLLNTAGGLTDGDRISVEVTWRSGAQAICTTQAAERIYRSRGGPASIRNTLSVGANATAFWLPQETILFDGGQFERTLKADIADGGRLLACESTVFGRSAMGETVEHGLLLDRWRVRYVDELVFADGFRLDGEISQQMKRPALLRDATAIASVVLVHEAAKDFVEPIRSVLNGTASIAGCSSVGPVLVIRLLSPSGAEMRSDLVAILEQAMKLLQPKDNPKEIAALPRVWSC
ncbi:MAG: urease accessory protein UreD [Pseudomonadota bacterium]